MKLITLLLTLITISSCHLFQRSDDKNSIQKTEKLQKEVLIRSAYGPTNFRIVLNEEKISEMKLTQAFLGQLSNGNYDGITFSRYIEGVIYQFKPSSSFEAIKSEIKDNFGEKKSAKKGSIGLVIEKTGEFTGEFFILLRDVDDLDTRFPIIGSINEGLENLLKYGPSDNIISMTLL